MTTEALAERNDIRKSIELELAHVDRWVRDYRGQLDRSGNSVCYTSAPGNLLSVIGRLIDLQARLDVEDSRLLDAHLIEVIG